MWDAMNTNNQEIISLYMIPIDEQVCLNFLNTNNNIAYIYILRGFRSY